MNIYKYKFLVNCPNNPKEAIEYSLKVSNKKMILAEDIVLACTFSEPIFHEEIADKLCAKLPGKQEIKAIHCNVEVVTIRCGL